MARRKMVVMGVECVLHHDCFLANGKRARLGTEKHCQKRQRPAIHLSTADFTIDLKTNAGILYISRTV